MTNLMLTIMYLQPYAVFSPLLVFPMCKLCSFYLCLRVSCEQPPYSHTCKKKRGAEHKTTNKNTVVHGYQLNLPYWGTLPSHSSFWLKQSFSPIIESYYVYRGSYSFVLLVTYPSVCVLFLLCYIHYAASKTSIIPIQFWFMYILLCDLYSCVQTFDVETYRLYDCHANAGIVGCTYP